MAAVRRGPRSVVDYLRDLAASKAAQRSYMRQARRLREQAAAELAEGKPLTARVTRYRAFIAEGAARAEFFDPEPRP